MYGRPLTEEERLARAMAGMRNPYTDPKITMESQVNAGLRDVDPSKIPGYPQAPGMPAQSGDPFFIRKGKDFSPEEATIQNQRDYANTLRGQAMASGKEVGPLGVYVGPNWGEQLAYVGRQALGGHLSGAADKSSSGLSKAMEKDAAMVSQSEADAARYAEGTRREERLGDMQHDRDMLAEQIASDEKIAGVKTLADMAVADRDAVADLAKGETGLRKEFSGLPHIKEFKVVDNSMQRVIESAKKSIDGSDVRGAGDMALIFNYMKMLDPLSVVRESEYATAANATQWLVEMENRGISVPLPIAQLIQKVSTGAKLSDPQRKDFVNRAVMLHDGAMRSYQQTASTYGGLAESYKFDPDRVVTVLPTDIGDANREFLAEQARQTDQAQEAEEVATDGGVPADLSDEVKSLWPHMTDEERAAFR